MNHDERINDESGVRPEHLDIDALLDGEPVERQALRAALEHPDARDYLVDALMLRQMTREMGPAQFAIPGTPRSAIVRRMRWLAAGLIVAVSAGAGYAYGKGSRNETSPGRLEVVIDNRPAVHAPEPTRTIRFEPGVNWTENRSR
jgi:hypothetical protein